MIGELDRRLANIVRVGTIAALDEAGARAKVDLGDITTDWLPWATVRAGGDRSWSAHEVGEQVMVLAPSGELASAAIMGAIPQDAHPAPASSKDHTRYEWSDGAFVDYDRAGHVHRLDVPAGGSITLHIGGTTLKLEDGKATLTTPQLLVDAPQSLFTGRVTVQGLLTGQGGMAMSGGTGETATISGSLKVTGGTNLAGVTSNGHDIGNSHKHTGVASGAGTSGPPQ
jgi:phage baseplate assembly protein V